MPKLPPESLFSGDSQCFSPLLIFNLGIQILPCQEIWLTGILLDKLVRKARGKREKRDCMLGKEQGMAATRRPSDSIDAFLSNVSTLPPRCTLIWLGPLFIIPSIFDR